MVLVLPAKRENETGSRRWTCRPGVQLPQTRTAPPTPRNIANVFDCDVDVKTGWGLGGSAVGPAGRSRRARAGWKGCHAAAS